MSAQQDAELRGVFEKVRLGDLQGVENAFDNSVWVFKGAVHVTMETGSMNSDEAQVTFTNKVLSKAVVTGRPAL